MRKTYISRTVIAGCFACRGSEAIWSGPQCQGTAARHHDATGHPTWCDVFMSVRYGDDAAAGEQLDIETAIGAAA